MKQSPKPPTTGAQLINLIGQWDLTDTRRRDLISAVSRICEMIGESPALLQLDVAELRVKLKRILPAAHHISAKTLVNLRSLFLAALEQAGVIQRMVRGSARRDPEWSPLVIAIADDKQLSCGLASFMNWNVVAGLHPSQVNDQTVP